jgi:hypothetical protein
MGYVSSLLGSNVVSSYLHIDNLRNDLTAGKHYETAGTKYIQSAHDGTDGIITVSSGLAKIKAATGFVDVYGSAGVHYLRIGSDNTNGTITPSTGLLQLRSNVHIGVAGGATALMYLLDTSSQIGVLTMSPYFTLDVAGASSGIRIQGTSNAIHFGGTGASDYKGYIYDNGTDFARVTYRTAHYFENRDTSGNIIVTKLKVMDAAGTTRTLSIASNGSTWVSV